MAGEVEAEVGSPGEAYVHYIPEGRWTDHFSSLLFSADPLATAIEVMARYWQTTGNTGKTKEQTDWKLILDKHIFIESAHWADSI